MNIKDIFTDEKGEVVIAQFPNKPLWSAIAFYLVRFIPFRYSVEISQWGVLVSLFYWSYLEIRYGVNLFRRVLGVCVAGYLTFRLFIG